MTWEDLKRIDPIEVEALRKHCEAAANDPDYAIVVNYDIVWESLPEFNDEKS